MSSVVKAGAKKAANKSDLAKLAARITAIISQDTMDVFAETLITIIVYGITVSVMLRVAHPYTLTFMPGLYSLAMCFMWGIRFVRHFDDSATNNELRDQMDERFAELENEFTQLKDAVIRNSIP